MKKVLTVGPEDFRDRMKDILGLDNQIFYEASTNDEALDIHIAENVNMIVTMMGIQGMEADMFFSRIRNDSELNDVAIVLACKNNESNIYGDKNIRLNGTIFLENDNHRLADTLKTHLNVPRRLSYRVITRIKIDGASGDTTLFGVMQNLSSTGMLIESDSKLENGEELKFSFSLPKSKRIHTGGEVIRVAKGSKTDASQYGIKFKGLNSAAQKDIQSYVENRN